MEPDGRVKLPSARYEGAVLSLNQSGIVPSTGFGPVHSIVLSDVPLPLGYDGIAPHPGVGPGLSRLEDVGVIHT